MGRCSRSPAGQGAEEGPGGELSGQGARTPPEPRQRSRSGFTPPVGRARPRGKAALCFDRAEAWRAASESQRARLRNSSWEQRGIGLCVCRLELRAEAFGPEAPAVTPQDPAEPSKAFSQR